MEDYEKEAIAKIIENRKKRLFALEQMAALQGFDTPAHIKIEIEEIRKEFVKTQNKVDHLTKGDQKQIKNILVEMTSQDGRIIELIGHINNVIYRLIGLIEKSVDIEWSAAKIFNDSITRLDRALEIIDELNERIKILEQQKDSKAANIDLSNQQD